VLDEARLLRLADKQEIHDVLLRWCRGIDRGDEALMASCYHADAIDEHGSTNYTGETAAHGYISKHKRVFKRHMHLTLNALIEVDADGERATSESYFVASLVPNQSGPEALMLAGGRYLDRLERRGGDWRIAHRHMIMEWLTKADQVPNGAWRALVDTQSDDLLAHEYPYTGDRSPADASYQYLPIEGA
jgi:ketosteroid isomerase-like protein